MSYIKVAQELVLIQQKLSKEKTLHIFSTIIPPTYIVNHINK